MDDEIDLRAYVDVLLRRWKWIVGLTLLATVLAAVASYMIPPTYEATSTVFVSQLSSGANGLSPQAELTILQSQDVASQAVQMLESGLSADDKRAMLSGDTVRVAADPVDKTLFRITARANSAQKAKDFANSWADAGSAQVNQRQNDQLDRQLQASQQRVELTGKDLQAAEEELKRRQREVQLELVTQELTRTLGILDSQAAERERVKSALMQAQALRQQVQQDQISLTAEMLLNLQSVATTSGNSLLIQPGQVAALNKQQQTAQLEALVAALNGKQQALTTSIDTVSAQAISLQQQLSDKNLALMEPIRARDTALSSYKSATNQLEEAQSRFAASKNPARAIPVLVAPDSPVEPKKAQIIMVAGALGALVGIIGVFATHFFVETKQA